MSTAAALDIITDVPAVPTVTGLTFYGRRQSGPFHEVTMRDTHTVWIRVRDDQGPVVQLTNDEFAALGPIPTGHEGLNIGDRVTVSSWCDGQLVDSAPGVIESVRHDRTMIGRTPGRTGVMVHGDGDLRSVFVPLYLPHLYTVTPAPAA